MPANGKYSVGYYISWAIYVRQFLPKDIPVDHFTHLPYAFAKVEVDGNVVLGDSGADSKNLPALYEIKKSNRNLKVLMGIGGYNNSPNFHPVVVNSAYRATFVDTSIKMMVKYGLDGLDVDYEFPTTKEQADGLACLLKELRTGLDAEQTKQGAGVKFYLTIAQSCGPDKYNLIPVKEMDASLDYWSLMAYDFAAATWDPKIPDHQAKLHGDAPSGEAAVKFFISKGVSANKLVLGLPVYGRSWAGTDGLHESSSGPGPNTWGEAGVCDYRVLPFPGATVTSDPVAGASYSYDSKKREFISYDNDVVGKWKGEYIKKEGLGGAMFWEISADRRASDPGKSLVVSVKDAMGELEQSNNWLPF